MYTATQDQQNHETSPPSSQTRAVHHAVMSSGPRFVGTSPAIREVTEALAKLAPLRTPVLLVGEAGTGKRYFAWMLHDASGSEHFAALDAETPIDATTLRGAAELAQGGTLLILGVERLDLERQDELLAIAQRGDMRLIVATQSSLAEEVAEGRVRAELHALFATSTVKLPSLRERAEDLPQLVQQLFELQCSRARRNDLRGVSPEAMALLEAHPFVDNVRGLEVALGQAVEFAEGPYVTAADLPEELRRPSLPSSPLLLGALPPQGIDLRAAVEEFETRMILQALERTGWNKNRASRLLGLNRTTLVEMIKRKRLAPPAGYRKGAAAFAATNPSEDALAAE